MSETRRFSFLQVSDVHLDSRQLAVGQPLSQAQRQVRNRELLETFLKALALARTRQVEAVLLIGDLWENETVTSDTITTVIQACAALGEIPVVISPGNRDYYDISSPYNGKALSIRGLSPWQANVHIFSESDFSTWQHPHRGDVSFSGRAFTGCEPESGRLLKAPVARDETADINILLFHGFLDSYTGADAGWEDKLTAPFSWAELKQQGFTYVALGHCHEYSEVRTENGLLLGAYAGCLAGRNFDELGERVALLGNIRPGRPGRWNCTLEPIELDTRRLIMVGADVTGLSAEDMMDEITLSIEDQGGRLESDIIYLHLEGQYGLGSEPQSVVARLKESYSELVAFNNTRPDYLSEKYDPRTTEWKFIEALIELKKQIEVNRGGADESAGTAELSGLIVEDALYYGLDALKQQKVTVRNVD